MASWADLSSVLGVDVRNIDGSDLWEDCGDADPTFLVAVPDGEGGYALVLSALSSVDAAVDEAIRSVHGHGLEYGSEKWWETFEGALWEEIPE